MRECMVRRSTECGYGDYEYKIEEQLEHAGDAV